MAIMMNRIFSFALLASVMLTSCRSTKPETVTEDPAAAVDAADPDEVAAFKKKGGKGGFHVEALAEPLTVQNSKFVVDLDNQQAYLYQNGKLVAFSPISSGRKYYRTETGNYTIGQKDLNHRSSSYGSFVSSKGGTIMGDVQNGFDPTPPGARFQGALMKYFHRLDYKGRPTAMGFHVGNLPGYPASHGCIRMPEKMASWFWKHSVKGIPVEVKGKKNGVPVGASQNRPKRSPKVHPSLKKKTPSKPSVPTAPESDVNTPAARAPASEPAAPAAEAPVSTPAPAPAAEAPAPAPAEAPAAPAEAPASAPAN